MYSIEIHKLLKNGPKNKKVPLFKRGEHVKYKYIIRNEFWLFQNAEKGAKPKVKLKATLNDIYMTSEVNVDLWSPK